MMTDVEKIYNLMYARLYMHLVNQSPVLSGNMRHHIKGMGMDKNKATIMITAPSYDLNKWRKKGVIIYTHRYNYANWVNEIGAFGKRNKSMHWVNRACYDIAQIVANEIGGEVINELPL